MSSTEALNCKWSKKCISCSCFAVLTNWTLFILLRSWVICVSIIEEEILFPRAHTIIASRSQENWPFNILRNNVLMIQRPWNKSLHLWQFLGILAFQVTNVTKYGFFFPWPHYYITIKKKKVSLYSGGLWVNSYMHSWTSQNDAFSAVVSQSKTVTSSHVCKNIIF